MARRQRLGTGEVVLGGVEHGDPARAAASSSSSSGTRPAPAARAATSAASCSTLDLGLGELGTDALGQGRQLLGALVELGVLAGPQRLVVGLPGECGGRAVERQQPGEDARPRRRRAGRRAGPAGRASRVRPTWRRRAATSSRRPVQGGEVAAQARRPARRRRGCGHPLDVARRGRPAAPRAAPRPARLGCAGRRARGRRAAPQRRRARPRTPCRRPPSSCSPGRRAGRRRTAGGRRPTRVPAVTCRPPGHQRRRARRRARPRRGPAGPPAPTGRLELGPAGAPCLRPARPRRR